MDKVKVNVTKLNKNLFSDGIEDESETEQFDSDVESQQSTLTEMSQVSTASSTRKSKIIKKTTDNCKICDKRGHRQGVFETITSAKGKELTRFVHNKIEGFVELVMVDRLCKQCDKNIRLNRKQKKKAITKATSPEDSVSSSSNMKSEILTDDNIDLIVEEKMRVLIAKYQNEISDLKKINEKLDSKYDYLYSEFENLLAKFDKNNSELEKLKQETNSNSNMIMKNKDDTMSILSVMLQNTNYFFGIIFPYMGRRSENPEVYDEYTKANQDSFAKIKEYILDSQNGKAIDWL